MTDLDQQLIRWRIVLAHAITEDLDALLRQTKEITRRLDELKTSFDRIKQIDDEEFMI